MAVVNPIQVGEEVTLRGLPDKPVGVVTFNTKEHFCVLTKEGITFNTSLATANPMKTGRRFDVKAFLRQMQI